MIPIPTVKRYPSYLRILGQARENGERYISATTLADELGLKSIQVRKDISATGIEGRPKVGFDIEERRPGDVVQIGGDGTEEAERVLVTCPYCHRSFSIYL